MLVGPGGRRVRKEYGRIRPSVTKDGAVIRERIHPDQGTETALLDEQGGEA